MAYSISTIKVTVKLLIWMSVSKSTQSTNIQGHVPDIALVSNIIDFMKPYIDTLQHSDTSKRSFEVTGVEKAIDAKIKELEPFFQDADFIGTGQPENSLELEGDDETTIIEFVPKAQSFNVGNVNNESESFLTNIRKYKKMRNKIKLTLEKESVTNKTKKMVTKTLDQLIAKLVGSQCLWNSDANKLSRKSYIESIKMDTDLNCSYNGKPLTKEECDKMIKNITDTIKAQIEPELKKAENLFKNLIDFQNLTFNFVDNLNKTFTNIVRESPTISHRYKVKCSLVDMNKAVAKTALSKKAGKCDYFRICSRELREYLIDFHKSLIYTAVSVFRNYAEMYARDVNNEESEEKKSVITIINNVSDIVEDRVSKAFIKHTSKIKLNENKNRDSNVEVIKQFVRNTVEYVNRKIKKHLEGDLSKLRARLLLPVQQDININLDAELETLQKKYLKRVCSFFNTCNGEVVGSYRKQERSPKQGTNGNSVYVKVQLTLDDDLRDTILKTHREFMKNGKLENLVALRKHMVQSVNSSNARATRTTLMVAETTTKSISSTVNNTHADSLDVDNEIKK